MRWNLRVIAKICFVLSAAMSCAAATRTSIKRHATPVKTHLSSANHERASTRRGGHVISRRGVSRRGAPVYRERFTTSSFSDNLNADDVVTGEDPIVRAAAVQALGRMNGTALAIDPTTGRILAMVNQKLALSAGAEPCSTIKIAVALAALKEGLVHSNTPVMIGRHDSLDLTHALARSVNIYFETLGRQLGFERVKRYANEFGLGELAGYNIEGEHLGVYPDQPLPARAGGVGKMCSFGESISMTPLQLGAMVSAVANGGTLYYLQHPTTPEEVAAFHPRVKRELDIKDVIPDLLPGMEGAVDLSTGTARSLRTNFVQFPVFGKTGTCSNDHGTRYGWFVSYGNAPTGPIVTVIFLNGDRGVFGPRAAELTGEFYRAMYERDYFTPKAPVLPQPSMASASANGAGPIAVMKDVAEAR